VALGHATPRRGPRIEELQATRATEETYWLGEGVIWDHLQDRVIWVDIEDGKVLSAHFDGESSLLAPAVVFDSPHSAGCVVLSADGGLLVAAEDRVIHLSASGSPSTTTALFSSDTGRRLNDGTCDPQGRLLVGTLRRTSAGVPAEELLRLEADGSTTVLRDGLTLSNGLAFSPDGLTLYHVDTLTSTISSCRYGIDPTLWAVNFTVDGYPDGMCADAEGNLWIAMWGKGEVRRYSPGGRLLARVHVPAPNVSCVAFVGRALDTLAITTARQNLSSAELERYPASGAVHLAKPGQLGIPTYRWSGGRW
jgi:sugar lactone lactonase YvrE